ncbi:MAG: lipopolysaccharide transport periplasmic protein LptA [Desulfobacterales bacterium]
MRIFLCKCVPCCILTAMSLIWISGCICPAEAEPHAGASGVVSAKSSAPVTITADELISDDASETAEFIGHVKVVRGDYTLTADRLKVHYKRSDRPSTPKAVGRANIREIVAEGDVRIVSSELTATAERAVYDAQTRSVELSGEDSTVAGSGGTVSGSNITLFLDTDRFQVSGGPEKRVRAVFNRTEKK